MGIGISQLWGSVNPTEVIGYKVVVVPKSYSSSCWGFLVLLPAGGEEPEDLVCIRDVAEATLEIGDTFSVYRLCHEEEPEYKEMPVVWISPQSGEPEWLTPPRSLMN